MTFSSSPLTRERIKASIKAYKVGVMNLKCSTFLRRPIEILIRSLTFMLLYLIQKIYPLNLVFNMFVKYYFILFHHLANTEYRHNTSSIQRTVTIESPRPRTCLSLVIVLTDLPHPDYSRRKESDINSPLWSVARRTTEFKNNRKIQADIKSQKGVIGYS